jgi:hypothetical protein
MQLIGMCKWYKRQSMQKQKRLELHIQSDHKRFSCYYGRKQLTAACPFNRLTVDLCVIEFSLGADRLEKEAGQKQVSLQQNLLHQQHTEAAAAACLCTHTTTDCPSSREQQGHKTWMWDWSDQFLRPMKSIVLMLHEGEMREWQCKILETNWFAASVYLGETKRQTRRNPKTWNQLVVVITFITLLKIAKKSVCNFCVKDISLVGTWFSQCWPASCHLKEWICSSNCYLQMNQSICTSNIKLNKSKFQ